MWKPFKFTVSSNNLSLLEPSWWAGWKNVGSGESAKVETKRLQLMRHEQDGWVDFFIGNIQPHTPYQSVLDGKAKIGLHYRDSDLYDLYTMACPSADIPDYLWQSLQAQCRL